MFVIGILGVFNIIFAAHTCLFKRGHHYGFLRKHQASATEHQHANHQTWWAYSAAYNRALGYVLAPELLSRNAIVEHTLVQMIVYHSYRSKNAVDLSSPNLVENYWAVVNRATLFLKAWKL